MKSKMVAGICATAALAVGASGAAWAQSTGTETFLVHAVGYPDHYSVAAAGPIHGTGTETVSDETFQDNGDGTSTFQQVSEFALQRGTVALLITGSLRTDVDPRTCVGSIDGTITWTILSGRSTGDYAGATGSGTGTVMDRFVAPRDANGCVEAEEGPNVFVARLHGTASLA